MKTDDIWLAQLDPTGGAKVQKTRHCVVISPNEMTADLRTFIVAPMTMTMTMTTGSRPAHFCIPFTRGCRQTYHFGGNFFSSTMRSRETSM